MPRRISPQQLIETIGSGLQPLVVDVRRTSAFKSAPTRIPGSIWRDHMQAAAWLPALGPERDLVVYCIHGHNVSALAAALLEQAGARVSVLEGGIEAYAAAGGPLVSNQVKDIDAVRPSVWITRERPKIDRIACPWLIRRFIDPLAVFHFVPAEWVRDIADELGAIPFDIADVHYSHRDDTCTFDTLIAEFGLTDPALLHLARIVRGADTARPELEPQAAGLLAISLGLSAIEKDDLVQLERGMLIYDALYGWCRHAVQETHNWPAKTVAA
jgi:rhodanese-related sulfurtransferase